MTAPPAASGIGDPVELKAHGIAVRTALKGVGQNLQDHTSAGVDCLRKEQGPLHRKLRLDRIVPEVARAHFFGTGMAASVPNNVMAFLKSDTSANIPDVQLLFRVAPMDAVYLAPQAAPPMDWLPPDVTDRKAGRHRLASADPASVPRIAIDFSRPTTTSRLARRYPWRARSSPACGASLTAVETLARQDIGRRSRRSCPRHHHYSPPRSAPADGSES
jgi:choline dehydrogenase-like flavoprotein